MSTFGLPRAGWFERSPRNCCTGGYDAAMTERQFTLTQQQYETLVALAQKGVAVDRSVDLEAYLQDIEKANGIVRDTVYVQWQELDSALPPGTRFPDRWPPELRGRVQYIGRKVSRPDVEQYIKRRARNPGAVYVTRDPTYVTGLSTLDQFFR